MKVLLLRLEEERRLFYSEGPETPSEDEEARNPPKEGVRGWLEAKYRGLQTTITGAESGVGLHMRRAWEWLQRRTAPDEAMLRALRNAEAVHLYYPATMEGEEALDSWTDYLRSRVRRHTLWLILNALITPLTLLLAPIPGPNIIGYWFLYRAVCHLLALLGVRRALSREKVETELFASGALEEFFGAEDEERLRALAESFGLKNLDAFVKRAAGASKDEQKKGTLPAVS